MSKREVALYLCNKLGIIMLLDQIEFIKGGYLNHLERYVNDGSISGFTQKYTTSAYTNPFVGDKNFNLYTCSVKKDWVISIGEIPNFLKTTCTSSDFIFIHPDMVNDLSCSKVKIDKSDYKAVPTSSSRTVHLKGKNSLFIKLHYNGIIGRINRDLTHRHALASVELTQMIKEVLDNNIDFKNVCILPESGAKIIYNEVSDYDFGMVIRDAKPYGHNSSNVKYMIPAFSLFSKDRKNLVDPTIISQLINRNDDDPKQYLLDNILIPLVKIYFNFIRTHGLQLELHSQNFFIGLDEDFHIVAFIMKDMESIDIDETYRKELGLKSKLKCYPYKHIEHTQYNYKIKHSFMFDYKLCEYTLLSIIQSVCKDYGLESDEFIDAVKSVVNKEIKLLPNSFYPKDWYVFENVLIDRSTSARHYVNKGKPIFRN